MKVKSLFLEAIKSRAFATLWVLNLIETVVLVVLTLVNAHSGLTIQTHCDIGGSVPDCTSAEAPWYYLYNLAAAGLIFFAINLFVSLKLLEVKGRQLALAWLWLTLVILFVATALLVTFAHYGHKL